MLNSVLGGDEKPAVCQASVRGEEVPPRGCPASLSGHGLGGHRLLRDRPGTRTAALTLAQAGALTASSRAAARRSMNQTGGTGTSGPPLSSRRIKPTAAAFAAAGWRQCNSQVT